MVDWFSLIQNVQLERPYMFALIAPLLALLFLLLIINFVKFTPEEKQGLWKFRLWILFSRGLIIVLLVVALASPYILEISTTPGTPTLTILIDNSTSMELFDFNPDVFVKQLEQYIPVKVDYLGSGLSSRIGDGIFRHMQDKNLFVISDGQNEKGSMDFFDVVTLANRFNTTINTIKLVSKKKDAAISLQGPGTTIVDTPYYFTLKVSNAKEPVHVVVTIDDRSVYDERTTQEETSLSHVFSATGDHKVVAQILDTDNFEINNKFYKVIDVVEKPLVLYFSDKQSKVDELLNFKYKIEKTTVIPSLSELKKYFMVVVNDKLHDINYDAGKVLEAYTDDGDGLVIFGGKNSFKGPSSIDLILPVKVGEVEEKQSDFNFVFLIDSSGIINEQLTDREIIAVEMLKVLGMRKESINVAVLDFSFGSTVIQPFTSIDKLSAIYEAMKGHEDQTKLEGVTWARPALINSGLKGAMDYFGDKQGNNNIIIVSYGQGFFQEWLENALELAHQAKNRGIRVHSIIVPSTFLDNRIGQDTLGKLSSAGRGMFMTNPVQVRYLFEKALIIANNQHWITQGLELSASVSGFNEVIPVASAISLITTGTGAPIVTINNYNKVAVISTDDGEKWADQMYEGKNIVLVSHVFDWAVGDLNRKKDSYVKVEDARINRAASVEYKGPSMPSTDACKFYAKDDLFECKYVPPAIGFDRILNTDFGVNYDPEYERVGYNERDMQMLAEQTKGNQYNADNIQGIVIAAKESARLKIKKKTQLDWIFVAVALVLLMLEILIRRLTQRLQSRKMTEF